MTVGEVQFTTSATDERITEVLKTEATCACHLSDERKPIGMVTGYPRKRKGKPRPGEEPVFSGVEQSTHARLELVRTGGGALTLYVDHASERAAEKAMDTLVKSLRAARLGCTFDPTWLATGARTRRGRVRERGVRAYLRHGIAAASPAQIVTLIVLTAVFAAAGILMSMGAVPFNLVQLISPAAAVIVALVTIVAPQRRMPAIEWED